MNININNYEAYFLDYHEGNLSPQQVADLFLFLSQHPELKKEFEDFEQILLEDFAAPVFENKDRLKKNITAENREEYFIRAVEGTLDPTELALLTHFLAIHPEYQTEFSLFQKTKLQPDASVIFENKVLLKQADVVNDDQLIAAVEGLLTKEELRLLEQQLTLNPGMQRSFVAYQQTKVTADNTIIFKDKQTLKRKERKVVPLYYYIAVAASLVLLLGILSLLKINNNNGDDQRIAGQKIQPAVEQQKIFPSTTTTPDKKDEVFHSTSPVLVAVTTKKQPVKKSQPESKFSQNAKNLIPEKTAHTEEVAVTDPAFAAVDLNSEKKDPVPVKTDSVHVPSNNNTAPVMARIEKKEIQPAFPSIGDLLASRLKEKLMGKDAVETEKHNASSGKITGWDIAGIFAKGLSKITGKKVEIKPQFNEQGNVTAYALSAGRLEFSKGRLK